MDLKGLINIGLIGIFFGCGIVAARFGVGQVAPLVYTGLRLGLAFAAFACLYSIARKRYPFPLDYKLWGHALLLGIFGMAIPMGSFVTALQYQSSGVSAIFVTTGPALIALLAHFLLPHERLNIGKSIGILLALSGALLIALSGESGLADFPKANPLGYLLVFISICSHSTATIYIRKYMKEYRTFDITGLQSFIGMLVLLTISGLTTGFDFQRVDITGIFSLLYTGLLSTFAGFLLYNATVKQFGATTAAMSLYVTPVVATLTGVLLLGETMTLRILIGMIIILGGISLVNFGSR